MFLLLITSAVISMNVSCGKEDEDPFVNKVPQLEFVYVSPEQATEFEDSLVFIVRYRDNNGDLGENNPDVKNLFLTDRRINLTYEYRIRQLAPQGQSVPITGNLEIVLPTVARTDTLLAQELVDFSIYVVDRAGNKSNVVVSTPVRILKP
jgi:hypothetical protein